jgi:hypothetical protein
VRFESCLVLESNKPVNGRTRQSLFGCYSLLDEDDLVWGTLSLSAEELELDSTGFIGLDVLRILGKPLNDLLCELVKQ